jgi:hypothetical protein
MISSGIPVGPIGLYEVGRTSLFRFEGATPPVFFGVAFPRCRFAQTSNDYRTSVPSRDQESVRNLPPASRRSVAINQVEAFMPAPVRCCGRSSLENSIASTSIFSFQATKSQRWMPWRLKPKKDVGGCDKPRGAADRASIRGCPNEETQHP